MPTSTIEDNDQLLVRLQAGDTSARQEMIERNMPLVVKCVERMVKKHPKLCKHFDDLAGTGFLALTEAVDQLAKKKCNTGVASAPTGYLKTTIYRSLCQEICCSGVIQLPQRTLHRWRQEGKLDAEEVSLPVVESLEAIQARQVSETDPLDRNLMQTDPGPEHFEVLEDLLQCCHTDLEREIILLRAQSLTLEEVGQQVGRDQSRVSRILSAIQQRYDSTNLS